MKPAIVDGWHVTSLIGVVYPGLLRGGGPSSGYVLEGLTADEWDVIDAFEDELYELRLLELRGGLRAWAYTCPSGSSTATGAAWDKASFVHNDLASYVNRCQAW